MLRMPKINKLKNVQVVEIIMVLQSSFMFHKPNLKIHNGCRVIRGIPFFD